MIANFIFLISLFESLFEPINADDSALAAPKFQVNDRVRITKYKNIFSKVYTENWSREIFFIDSLLETNPWTYKLKNLIR